MLCFVVCLGVFWWCFVLGFDWVFFLGGGRGGLSFFGGVFGFVVVGFGLGLVLFKKRGQKNTQKEFSEQEEDEK